MLILFSLIVMRMTGAVAFNPLLGRVNVPSRAKTALIFVLSLMLYIFQGGELVREPETMLEYGVMLICEMFFGFVIGFSMELTVLVIQFASAVMDYSMGLSMAQIYDPQHNTQMTVTNGVFYACFWLLFMALDGHIWLIGLFFRSAREVPFGQVSITPELAAAMLELFNQAIYKGLQFAFPIIAVELITESAVGILMKVIPQMNVFAVNFQIKLIIGMLMLLYLFGPISGHMYDLIGFMEQTAEGFLPLF